MNSHCSLIKTIFLSLNLLFSFQSLGFYSDQDSLTVMQLIEESKDYYFNNVDSLDKSVDKAREALEVSNRIDFNLGKIKAYNMIGNCYYQMGLLDSTIHLFEYAMEIQSKVSGKNMDYFRLKDNLADAYFDSGQKARALEYRFESRDYFLSQNDTNALLIAQTGLSYFYIKEKQWDKAKKELLFAKKFDNQSPYVIEPYGNLGIIYEKLNILDSAQYYMTKAGKMAGDYPLFFLDNQIALSEVMKKRGLNHAALDTLLSVHDIFDPKSKEISFHHLLLVLTEEYLERGNIEQAKYYLDRAGDLIASDQVELNMNLGRLGREIYKSTDDCKQTLVYTEKYYVAHDSLQSAQRDSAFFDIESKYNLEKKNAIITEQKFSLQKLYNLIVGLVALALLVGLVLFSFYRKRQFQNRILEERNKRQHIEIEALNKENQLISLQSVLQGQEEERRRIAQDLHDNIGSMMAAMKMKVMTIQKNIEELEKMNVSQELDKMIVQVGSEVRRISHNMTPLSFEHSGLFGAIGDLIESLKENNIVVDANIDALEKLQKPDKGIMIYRILQELIQNIIKHAQASYVIIDAELSQNKLSLSIVDNGLGIKRKDWISEASFGLNSLKSRIKYLDGDIKMINDNGTKILINIDINR